jgi:nitric oxide reductase large subunit
VNLLFVALIVVVGGSLIGEWLGIQQMLGRLWEWFGSQGWAYLDLGKAWQIGLAAGLFSDVLNVPVQESSPSAIWFVPDGHPRPAQLGQLSGQSGSLA